MTEGFGVEWQYDGPGGWTWWVNCRFGRMVGRADTGHDALAAARNALSDDSERTS